MNALKQLMLNTDIRQREIHRYLHHHAKSRATRLRTLRKRRFSTSVRQFCGAKPPSQFAGEDASRFLIDHGHRLISTVHELAKSLPPHDALFVLTRLPWRPGISHSSVTNARRLARAVLVQLPYSIAEKPPKAPIITRDLVDRVVLFEDLCADLHGTQSVFRVLEKCRFFGMQRTLALRDNGFEAMADSEVREAIDSYNVRVRRGGIEHWTQPVAPQAAGTDHRGLVVVPSHRPGPQLPLCAGESRIRVIDPNFLSGWPFVCFEVDTAETLRKLANAIDVDQLSAEQRHAVDELVYVRAVQEQLHEIRCDHIRRSKYAYDIERKGYIKLDETSMFNGLHARIERLAQSVGLTGFLAPLRENLDSWIGIQTARVRRYPCTIEKNWEFPLFARFDTHNVVCFPDTLSHMELEAHNRLNQGGNVGTNYYGTSFESYVREKLRNANIAQHGWIEWNTAAPFIHPETRKEVAQVDFACYRDDTLFVVDAKSFPEKLTLSREDANRQWKDIKLRLKSATETAQNLANFWNSLNPEPPSGIRYVIPVVCTPMPVFSKVTDRYWLASVELKRQLDDDPKTVRVPRICTVQEFVEVLSGFSTEKFIANGGMYREVGFEKRTG